MKLRKGLIAAATALTVSTVGVSVAGAETGVTATTTVSPAAAPTGQAEPGSSQLSSELNPDEIEDWIGVFTTAVAAVSAAFAFMDQNL